MLSDDTLTQLEALADAATPGPWSTSQDDNDQVNIYGPDHQWVALLPHQCLLSLLEQSARNGNFIAAARDAIPALIAEVRRLRELHRIATNNGMEDDCIDDCTEVDCSKCGQLYTMHGADCPNA